MPKYSEKYHGNSKTWDTSIKLSKREAVDAGFPAYWTGKACIHGHISHRYVCNDNCLDCEKPRRSRAYDRDSRTELAQSGIDMDIRRKIENAQIDALTVVDDWDY